MENSLATNTRADIRKLSLKDVTSMSKPQKNTLAQAALRIAIQTLMMDKSRSFVREEVNTTSELPLCTSLCLVGQQLKRDWGEPGWQALIGRKATKMKLLLDTLLPGEYVIFESEYFAKKSTGGFLPCLQVTGAGMQNWSRELAREIKGSEEVKPEHLREGLNIPEDARVELGTCRVELGTCRQVGTMMMSHSGHHCGVGAAQQPAVNVGAKDHRMTMVVTGDAETGAETGAEMAAEMAAEDLSDHSVTMEISAISHHESHQCDHVPYDSRWTRSHESRTYDQRLNQPDQRLNQPLMEGGMREGRVMMNTKFGMNELRTSTRTSDTQMNVQAKMDQNTMHGCQRDNRHNDHNYEAGKYSGNYNFGNYDASNFYVNTVFGGEVGRVQQYYQHHGPTVGFSGGSYAGWPAGCVVSSVSKTISSVGC